MSPARPCIDDGSSRQCCLGRLRGDGAACERPARHTAGGCAARTRAPRRCGPRGRGGGRHVRHVRRRRPARGRGRRRPRCRRAVRDRQHHQDLHGAAAGRDGRAQGAVARRAGGGGPRRAEAARRRRPADHVGRSRHAPLGPAAPAVEPVAAERSRPVRRLRRRRPDGFHRRLEARSRARCPLGIFEPRFRTARPRARTAWRAAVRRTAARAGARAPATRRRTDRDRDRDRMRTACCLGTMRSGIRCRAGISMRWPAPARSPPRPARWRCMRRRRSAPRTTRWPRLSGSHSRRALPARCPPTRSAWRGSSRR